MFSCQVGAGKVRDYWPYPRILWISSDKIRDVVFVILALGDLGQCGFFVGVAWHAFDLHQLGGHRFEPVEKRRRQVVMDFVAVNGLFAAHHDDEFVKRHFTQLLPEVRDSFCLLTVLSPKNLDISSAPSFSGEGQPLRN